MSKIFLIDVGRCTGCYNCQLACKDEHCENDWTPYAAPQPLTGQFWCRVTEHVQGTIPKVKIHYIPQMCAHCEKAKCMAVCRTQAITRRPDGFILIDPAKCAGCGECIRACPLDVIFFLFKQRFRYEHRHVYIFYACFLESLIKLFLNKFPYSVTGRLNNKTAFNTRIINKLCF